jgi:hypothetical protein
MHKKMKHHSDHHEGHLDPHHHRREGYNARLDESLGMRKGKKKSHSMKARRHESEGMEKYMHHHKYGAVKSMHRKRK